MSNAWVTYPEHWDSNACFGRLPKGLVIPDAVKYIAVYLIKGWGSTSVDLMAWERPMFHQLVGKVKAYQGYDGYRG